jgi:hypothetical protein
MKDFVSWLGRQGRSPAEVVLKEKAGENIGQGKPREDVREPHLTLSFSRVQVCVFES